PDLVRQASQGLLFATGPDDGEPGVQLWAPSPKPGERHDRRVVTLLGDEAPDRQQAERVGPHRRSLRRREEAADAEGAHDRVQPEMVLHDLARTRAVDDEGAAGQRDAICVPTLLARNSGQ